VRAWLIALGAAALWACGGSSSPGGSGSGGTGNPDGGSGSGGGGTGNPDGGGGSPDGGNALAAGGGDWSQYRGGMAGTSENPGVFDVAEAANLKTVWTAELGKYVYAQAMIAGDTAYFTTAFGAHVVALDAATGAQRWIRDDLNPDVTTACGSTLHRGFWAAPAVVGDVVYLAAPDGHAYALRKQDGTTLWASAIANPTAAGHGEFLQSSPVVSTALGRLYLGIASSEHCDEVRGKIAMVDLKSGAATVKALVGDGQQGGGIWSSISIDEAAGLVFASTANRIGDLASEPLAQAIVSFNAQTLDVVGHWQDPTTLENSDFGSSPTLFSSSDGTPLVAAANKDGWLYVLRRDRLSAGPIWKAQLAVIDPADPGMGGDPSAGFGSIVSPTFAHGLLYAAGGRTPAGDPGSIAAFDPGSGTVVWKHVTPGYVIAAMPAVGDILIAESSSADGSSSWLEVLDARNGAQLRRFPGAVATYAAPSVGRGLILWTDAFGHVTALASPRYRP